MATADDYTQQMIALSPQGNAWPQESSSIWVTLLNALAQEFARIDARDYALQNEIFPDTTVELLPDWERVAGLPDVCTVLGSSIDIRRKDLLTKLTWRGGASPSYFINLGASLGYTITITEFHPFRVDQDYVGEALCGDGWNYVWQVNSALNTENFFQAGRNTAGQPLATWGNERLECFFNHRKPSHTVLFFAYS